MSVIIRVCGGGRVCSSPNLSMLSVLFFSTAESQTCVGMNDERPSQQTLRGLLRVLRCALILYAVLFSLLRDGCNQVWRREAPNHCLAGGHGARGRGTVATGPVSCALIKKGLLSGAVKQWGSGPSHWGHPSLISHRSSTSRAIRDRECGRERADDGVAFTLHQLAVTRSGAGRFRQANGFFADCQSG